MPGYEGTRAGVNYAQPTERIALFVDQRCTGVEPNAGFAGDQRVAPKTGVAPRVWYFQYAMLIDQMGAKSMLARGFFQVGADTAFYPLASFVQQR